MKLENELIGNGGGGGNSGGSRGRGGRAAAPPTRGQFARNAAGAAAFQRAQRLFTRRQRQR